ncbi:MAG: Fic family protein [Thermoplasmatales archaeon]|nr:Fic family protein [Thermoplasmatales archaeon]
MVRVKKKVLGKQTYYYIEHTLREGGKILKKEKYIGKRLPKNIEEVKKRFLSEIYREKWYPLLDKIKENFSKEQKQVPKIAKEKELETFMIRFTYDTQRIEGSKLTLRETAGLFEKGITPKAKPIYDVKEAEAHREIFYDMMNYKKDLSLQIILYWHKKLFENTKKEIAGRIRQHQVAISGSRFLPPFPAEIYPLLREFFRWYAGNKNNLHPVELSALAHLKFVTIHPFADGNGRMSRIIMNFVLHKYDYPMLNIPYEYRTGYYNALERSQIKKLDSVFMQWLFRRYVKEYKGYVKD